MEYFRVAEPRPCVSPQKDSQEVQFLLPFLRAFPSFGGHGCSAKRRGELAAMTWPYSTHMGLSQNWGRRMDIRTSRKNGVFFRLLLPGVGELLEPIPPGNSGAVPNYGLFGIRISILRFLIQIFHFRKHSVLLLPACRGCAACATPLYSFQGKMKNGCGWAAFSRSLVHWCLRSGFVR